MFDVFVLFFLEQRYYTQLGKIVKQSQSTIAELEQHEVSYVHVRLMNDIIVFLTYMYDLFLTCVCARVCPITGL